MAWSVGVHGDGVHLLSEKQQAAVHDTHNEVRRLGQLSDSGDISRFYGLHKRSTSSLICVFCCKPFTI